MFRYVVFSVEHYDKMIENSVEKIREKKLKKIELKRVKESEIETRLSVFKEVCDIIRTPGSIKLHTGYNFQLDEQFIIGMGHSYGGATA